YLMTQGAPDRGEGNTGVAAGCFDNLVARMKASFLISFFQNMESHPVLNAACHVHMLGFGKDHALFSPEIEANGKQWGVPDQVLQMLEAAWSRLQSFHFGHDLNVLSHSNSDSSSTGSEQPYSSSNTHSGGCESVKAMIQKSRDEKPMDPAAVTLWGLKQHASFRAKHAQLCALSNPRPLF